MFSENSCSASNKKWKKIGWNSEEFTDTPLNCGLSVFPGELWELILGKLKHSQDILNVFIAFPDIDYIFHNKKFDRLFDLILPHIMTKYLLDKQWYIENKYDFLVTNQLLKLRLVSKRWKMAVESSIENHPDRHPTSSQDYNTTDSKSTAIVPENHFNYQRMQKFHVGATIFHQAKHVDRFLSEMGNYEGNPFPGIYVVINPCMSNMDTFYPITVKKALEILEKFGEHISILDWDIYTPLSCRDTVNLKQYKRIIKGLSYIPNIKSLTIRGIYNEPLKFSQVKEREETFPELPHLESFDWRLSTIIYDYWITRLMNTYRKHNGLRKLTLDLRYFNGDLGSNFGALTELHILLGNETFKNMDQIISALKLFPNNQIRKLWLSDDEERKKSKNFCINKFLRMLAGFQIESLILDEFYLSENDKDEFADDITVPSIAVLYLEDNARVKFQFLKRLPNLRFSNIYMNTEIYTDKREGNCLFGDMIRKYSTQYDSEEGKTLNSDFSIWDALPKLEMLKLSADNAEEILDVQYFKEYGNKPFFGQKSKAIDWHPSESSSEVSSEESDLNQEY